MITSIPYPMSFPRIAGTFILGAVALCVPCTMRAQQFVLDYDSLQGGTSEQQSADFVSEGGFQLLEGGGGTADTAVDALWVAAQCGNEVLEEGEECDGSDLGSTNCASLGFSGGDLTCTAQCAFDTSACAAATGAATGSDADTRGGRRGHQANDTDTATAPAAAGGGEALRAVIDASGGPALVAETAIVLPPANTQIQSETKPPSAPQVQGNVENNTPNQPQWHGAVIDVSFTPPEPEAALPPAVPESESTPSLIASIFALPSQVGISVPEGALLIGLIVLIWLRWRSLHREPVRRHSRKRR